jgi:hypothetical protein
VQFAGYDMGVDMRQGVMIGWVADIGLTPRATRTCSSRRPGRPGLGRLGVLIRVAPDGSRTTDLAGLDRPTADAIGADGACLHR